MSDELTVAEMRLVAQRERWRQDKAATRAAKLAAEQAAAGAPADGLLERMPAGLSQIRRWVRTATDLYLDGKMTSARLAEVRRSAGTVGDLYRVGADLRKAEAAQRAADAQERMADVLAQVEHGGAAVVLLERLRNGLTDGPRRPLPGRSRSLMPPESASS
jgi:hypothetical protein